MSDEIHNETPEKKDEVEMAQTEDDTGDIGSIQIGDALYLASSEHPGLSLAAKYDGGPGFPRWKHQVQIALASKNKLGFVLGTLK